MHFLNHFLYQRQHHPTMSSSRVLMATALRARGATALRSLANSLGQSGGAVAQARPPFAQVRLRELPQYLRLHVNLGNLRALPRTLVGWYWRTYFYTGRYDPIVHYILIVSGIGWLIHDRGTARPPSCPQTYQLTPASFLPLLFSPRWCPLTRRARPFSFLLALPACAFHPLPPCRCF